MHDQDKRTFHRLISEQTGREPEEFNDESQFLRDLIFDSLDVIELVMAVEEEFCCSIPDGDFEERRDMTVGDAIKLIDENLFRWRRLEGRAKSE